MEAENKEDRSLQSYSALGIGLLCLVLGLPLWWKTTEVYRCSLPYSAIDQLEFTKVLIVPDVEIIIPGSMIPSNSTDEFVQNLLNFLNKNQNEEKSKAYLVRVQYRVRVRELLNEESELLNALDTLKFADVHLTALLSKLDVLSPESLSNDEPGKYKIYVLPSTSSHLKAYQNAHIGTRRIAFIHHSQDSNKLLLSIDVILKDFFVREETLVHTYSATKQTEHAQADKRSMRALKTSLGYGIIFTLINPQPSKLNAVWDIEEALKVYMEPFLSTFRVYSNITVNSQYIYSVSITNNLAKKDLRCNCSKLTHSSLPHIINPIEPFLASHVSNYPHLNFVVYIPSREQTPLYILDYLGVKSEINAFLVPQWGGFAIYNVMDDEIDILKQPSYHQVRTDKIFGIFMSQIRSLLGFKNITTTDGSIMFDQPGKKIVSDWEMDAWLMDKCVENIAKSGSTLYSLTSLLNHISNIVINDEIGARVQSAVDSLEMSIKHLSNSNLKQAYLESRTALRDSEKAFFDPSLLEFLYFPDDQKFAIYIPLFLPIGIPIISSFVQAVRYLRKNKAADKIKTQ